jgi:hypothetical protein
MTFDIFVAFDVKNHFSIQISNVDDLKNSCLFTNTSLLDGYKNLK